MPRSLCWGTGSGWFVRFPRAGCRSQAAASALQWAPSSYGGGDGDGGGGRSLGCGNPSRNQVGLKKDEEICCFFVLNLQELRVIVVQREQLLKHTNRFYIFLFHRQTITNTRTSNIAAVCKDSKKRATIPFLFGQPCAEPFVCRKCYSAAWDRHTKQLKISHNGWLIQKHAAERLWPTDPQSSLQLHQKRLDESTDRTVSVRLYCAFLYIQVKWPPCAAHRDVPPSAMWAQTPLEAYTHLISCSSIHSPHIQITSLVSLAISAVNVVLDCAKKKQAARKVIIHATIIPNLITHLKRWSFKI